MGILQLSGGAELRLRVDSRYVYDVESQLS